MRLTVSLGRFTSEMGLLEFDLLQATLSHQPIGLVVDSKGLFLAQSVSMSILRQLPVVKHAVLKSRERYCIIEENAEKKEGKPSELTGLDDSISSCT